MLILSKYKISLLLLYIYLMIKIFWKTANFYRLIFYIFFFDVIQCRAIWKFQSSRLQGRSEFRWHQMNGNWVEQKF